MLCELSSKKLINRNDLLRLISGKDVDIVVAAISGSDGLELIHHSVISGKKVLIANKEPLVMAGEFIVNEAKKYAKLNPTFIAIEPPELIGTGRAVSTERPQLIVNSTNAVKMAKNSTKLLWGQELFQVKMFQKQKN